MPEWFGWAGTVLDVDLTSGKVVRKPLSKATAIKYLGGSGLGARIVYDEVKPGTDPLSADNVMVIGVGPLSGTAAPGCGRCEIITKGPQTGIYLRSNLGGFFGPEMKWAGYDAIVIRGQSPKPVYLWIEDDHVEIKDASHIWGKDTWTGRDIILDEVGDPGARVLHIGPAGENLSNSSCVMGDLARAAGKGGIGAVWGAKKLRAIAVRGSQGVKIADPEEFLRLCMELRERIKQDPTYDSLAHYGTIRRVSDPFVKQAIYQGHDMKDLFSDQFDKDFYDHNLACFNCPIHCSHFYSVKEGKYKGVCGEGLEGNTVIFGGVVMRVNSAAFACKYNTLCNQLGIHVDNPGLAIEWAMELYEHGIITKEDTGGLELTWGNEDAILELVEKIARREGFGSILDDYPVKAAERLGRGSDQYICHAKGMTGHGSGVALSRESTLAHAVSVRGYDHLIGSPFYATRGINEEITPEMARQLGEERYGDPRIFESWYDSPKKALLVYDTENNCTLCDITGVCKFNAEKSMYYTGWHNEDFARILTAATGHKFTAEDVVRVAERELLIERAFNAREGIRRIDDYPLVFSWQIQHGEPHPRYKDKKLRLDVDTFGKLLDDYYRVRGCDLETGAPSRSKLEGLGLKDIADDLAKRGIIK